MNNPKSVLIVSCLFFIVSQFIILNDAYSEVYWDGGGSLPHPGQNSGSGPNPWNNGHGDSGSNGGNNNGNHSNQTKPDGTPYLGYPNVVWTGDGNIRPADGYGWKTPANPGATNYKVVPLPSGTPHQKYPNVVWTGDGKSIRPADGYRWQNSNNPSASNFMVVPLTTNEKIEIILSDTKIALKDKRIRDWIANVKWKLNSDPGQQNQLSPWVGDSCLIFTQSFLTETEAMRENLIAFESGKLFFTMMKDKPVKGGKSMEIWFVDYSARYDSTIWNMKKTKHKEEDLSLLGDNDKESQFGYIFRAQALQLNKPKEQEAQHEWDKAIREFQKYISPLLRTK